ncbi:unnamed protein product [Amoebophrya sp. A120]|nr:unnamed protein product [Amoebophrya sp. A120]|eukprot:GSA120T00020093001.1
MASHVTAESGTLENPIALLRSLGTKRAPAPSVKKTIEDALALTSFFSPANSSFPTQRTSSSSSVSAAAKNLSRQRWEKVQRLLAKNPEELFAKILDKTTNDLVKDCAADDEFAAGAGNFSPRKQLQVEEHLQLCTRTTSYSSSPRKRNSKTAGAGDVIRNANADQISDSPVVLLPPQQQDPAKSQLICEVTWLADWAKAVVELRKLLRHSLPRVREQIAKFALEEAEKQKNLEHAEAIAVTAEEARSRVLLKLFELQKREQEAKAAARLACRIDKVMSRRTRDLPEESEKRWKKVDQFPASNPAGEQVGPDTSTSIPKPASAEPVAAPFLRQKSEFSTTRGPQHPVQQKFASVFLSKLREAQQRAEKENLSKKKGLIMGAVSSSDGELRGTTSIEATATGSSSSSKHFYVGGEHHAEESGLLHRNKIQAGSIKHYLDKNTSVIRLAEAARVRVTLPADAMLSAESLLREEQMNESKADTVFLVDPARRQQESVEASNRPEGDPCDDTTLEAACAPLLQEACGGIATTVQQPQELPPAIWIGLVNEGGRSGKTDDHESTTLLTTPHDSSTSAPVAEPPDAELQTQLLRVFTRRLLHKFPKLHESRFRYVVDKKDVDQDVGVKLSAPVIGNNNNRSCVPAPRDPLQQDDELQLPKAVSLDIYQEFLPPVYFDPEDAKTSTDLPVMLLAIGVCDCILQKMRKMQEEQEGHESVPKAGTTNAKHNINGRNLHPLCPPSSSSEATPTWTLIVEGHADEGISSEELQTSLSWDRAVFVASFLRVAVRKVETAIAGEDPKLLETLRDRVCGLLEQTKVDPRGPSAKKSSSEPKTKSPRSPRRRNHSAGKRKQSAIEDDRYDLRHSEVKLEEFFEEDENEDEQRGTNVNKVKHDHITSHPSCKTSASPLVKLKVQCFGRGTKNRISHVFGESWKNRRCNVYLKEDVG